MRRFSVIRALYYMITLFLLCVNVSRSQGSVEDELESEIIDLDQHQASATSKPQAKHNQSFSSHYLAAITDSYMKSQNQTSDIDDLVESFDTLITASEPSESFESSEDPSATEDGHGKHPDTVSNHAEKSRSTDHLGHRQLSIENATVWELMKEQIMNDLRPFLIILSIIVPKPIKAYVSQQFLSISRFMGNVLMGALTPALASIGPVLKLLGGHLIALGDYSIELGKKEKLDRKMIESNMVAISGGATNMDEEDEALITDALHEDEMESKY
jgi:hypothetical protein